MNLKHPEFFYSEEKFMFFTNLHRLLPVTQEVIALFLVVQSFKTFLDPCNGLRLGYSTCRDKVHTISRRKVSRRKTLFDLKNNDVLGKTIVFCFHTSSIDQINLKNEPKFVFLW